jgi:pyrroline-5-carboxylate reductase
MRIGFAGAGNMAAGMARGWAAARGEPGAPEALLFTDSGSGRASELASELGGEPVASNAELAERTDLVVLAVKPSGLAGVAAELAPVGTPVVSVLAATSVAALGEALPGAQFARTMPNLGVSLRQGVTCVAFPEHAELRFKERVLAALGLLGTVIELEDELMDPATALMGCSPGYLALIAESLIEAGVREGLDPEQAGTMVARSMTATGALLDRHEAAALREAVASPGGSTEAGLEALERRQIRAVIEEAVDASLERMRA